jgi:hypothetical protein
MNDLVKYVGLDVHKDTIAIAVAEADKRDEVREHGEHPCGAEVVAWQARRAGRGVADLLRSRALRIWHTATGDICRA